MVTEMFRELISVPSDGRAFTAEHGPWQNDEITALVNGGNGGWDPRPNVGGRGDCPDKYCGYMPNQKKVCFLLSVLSSCL